MKYYWKDDGSTGGSYYMYSDCTNTVGVWEFEQVYDSGWTSDKVLEP